MKWNVKYGQAHVRDMKIVGIRNTRTNKITVTGVEVNGQMAVPSPRFWKSLFKQFGISESVFRYFDHAEVFERISALAPNDSIRYCIESDEDGNRRLMAISQSKRFTIPFNRTINPSLN